MIRALTVAFLALALPAAAAETSYLQPPQVDLLRLLPPPPAAGSPQEQADLAETMRLQASRTPARAKQANEDAVETLFVMFGGILGPNATEASIPKTVALFQRLSDTEDVLTAPAKKSFARPRPFVNHPAVQPAIYKPGTPSYPSGHATLSTMTGIILGSMVPERREAIFARVQDYADSRVIGGVHYRTDVVAGMRAGTAIAAVLFGDPGFQADFAPARAELRKVLGLPP